MPTELSHENTLAAAMAEKVLRQWDAAAPSPFVKGQLLRPSLNFICACVTALFREWRVDPSQKPDTVADQISVRVLNAVPRFKRQREPLVLSLFGLLIS